MPLHRRRRLLAALCAHGAGAQTARDRAVERVDKRASGSVAVREVVPNPRTTGAVALTECSVPGGSREPRFRARGPHAVVATGEVGREDRGRRSRYPGLNVAVGSRFMSGEAARADRGPRSGARPPAVRAGRRAPRSRRAQHADPPASIRARASPIQMNRCRGHVVGEHKRDRNPGSAGSSKRRDEARPGTSKSRIVRSGTRRDPLIGQDQRRRTRAGQLVPRRAEARCQTRAGALRFGGRVTKFEKAGRIRARAPRSRALPADHVRPFTRTTISSSRATQQVAQRRTPPSPAGPVR